MTPGSWHSAIRALFCAIALGSCDPGAVQKPIRPAAELIFTAPDGLGERPALLLAAISDSRSHNRDPAHYLTPALRAALAAAQDGEARQIREADRALARAFVAWAHDLDTPRGAVPVESDPAAALPAFDGRMALRAAAAADDFPAHLDSLQKRHPVYAALASAMRDALAEGEDLTILASNLERARALPAAAGKHIVVDAAAARLWMYEGARQVGTMKVVIGRSDMPTPMMSGMIRHVVVQPYWNVPEDIVRDSVAPEVLRPGIRHVWDRDLEILSDWSPSATPIDPAAVDWRAVVTGAQGLRVRQRPGPANMMGRIKFMLPNDLGIYLHDTPIRDDFAQRDRAKSSGCVRVEDATRLANWLFNGKSPMGGKAFDRTVNLPVPVPVYINYFTRSPTAKGLASNPDIYKRDT